MERVVASAVLAFGWLSVATCQVQLPCDSVLRRFPSLSRFFQHCETECRYGNWTDVTPITNATHVAVQFDQCKSELALLGERWQVAINNSDDCENRREESYICSSTCSYSDWTEVTPNVNATAVRVPTYQCRSGLALPGERWKLALSGYECTENHCEECPAIIEEIHICEPTITERLILLLELGRTGQDHRHDSPDIDDSSGDRIRRYSSTHIDDEDFFRFKRSDEICSAKLACRSYYGGLRKRNANLEKSYIVKDRHRSSADPEPLPIAPIPFDIFRHGGRYRRQSNVECYPDGTRYILFMLDSSGSIEEKNFKTMTSTLSTLVQYFCRRIKVAVFTFTEDHYIEFCFDCFGNGCDGRDSAHDAIANIRYRAGLTFTGEATECACHHVLTPKCGFPDLSTAGERTCLDVMYVTDGQSNGPSDVCNTVSCFYDLQDRGVELNMFAFGIGEVNETELKCITRHQSNNTIDNAIFQVDTFGEFAEVINAISGNLFNITTPGNTYGLDILPSCFSVNASDGIGYDDCSNSST